MQDAKESRKKEIVTTLGNCPTSQTHLHRISTEDMAFVCTVCKEVLLKKHIPKHICESPAEKKPEAEDTLYYDTHCAVIDQESGVKCSRSLNCKVHSIFMKRAINKRSQPFDALLKKSMEERKKRKIEKDDEKADKREKITDECHKLEDVICSKLMSHIPIIEKTFYLPEIKFDTLAVRSLFFQPLKIYRMSQEKKPNKK
ncbi:hypothetical protein NEMIN01_1515 [Nematocida minor]|uniref:uncharacterized protein n=1 Tax=Nematocida minor TaxID=1912983 RepID=UPI0022202297|nr:uncharacterized protein NEMIN01_1515 [Nematocida minor]KAI5191439.1 hypothetical protein NEMIN01_1515 [Nematocida minor]